MLKSHNVRIYLFPDFVLCNGPTISIATLVKGSAIGGTEIRVALTGLPFVLLF